MTISNWDQGVKYHEHDQPDNNWHLKAYVNWEEGEGGDVWEKIEILNNCKCVSEGPQENTLTNHTKQNSKENKNQATNSDCTYSEPISFLTLSVCERITLNMMTLARMVKDVNIT